jgi:hypothetical protein
MRIRRVRVACSGTNAVSHTYQSCYNRLTRETVTSHGKRPRNYITSTNDRIVNR